MLQHICDYNLATILIFAVTLTLGYKLGSFTINFTHMPNAPNGAIVLHFSVWGVIANVITHTKFFINQFRDEF